MFKNLIFLSGVFVLLSTVPVHAMDQKDQKNNNENNNNKHIPIKQNNGPAAASSESAASSSPSKPAAASSKDASVPLPDDSANSAVKHINKEEEDQKARKALEEYLNTNHQDMPDEDRNALAQYIEKLISPGSHQNVDEETLGYLVSSIVWFVPSQKRDEYRNYISTLVPLDIDLCTRLRVIANWARAVSLDPAFLQVLTHHANTQTLNMTPSERANFLANFEFFPANDWAEYDQEPIDPSQYE